MKEIKHDLFYKVVDFIKEANNYSCGGSPRHCMNNDENYYIIRNGVDFLVAKRVDMEQTIDSYYVDDEILKRYKNLYGYTL